MFDIDGFMIDAKNWNADIAKQIAKKENIILTDLHMQIIVFAREYYISNKKSLAIRKLVSELKVKYGEKIGNSLYLQSLFPVSPSLQIAKIAGLPKPKRCI